MFECIIIGGGPAGLMCAHTLAKENIDYLLLEKNEKVGKKLLISGNKRCNVTNNKEVEDFISDLTIKNKKFLYSSLYTFGPREVIEFFKQLNVPLTLENDLKYFPTSNKAQSILDALLSNIGENKIHTNQTVKKIVKEENHFVIHTKEKTYKSKNVVIATGSQSFPNTGSSGDGLLFAKDLNIEYKEFTPAETHVYSTQIVRDFKELKGLSYKAVTVTIKNTKLSYKHDILFTHLGLSGPVIYHLSEFIYSESKNGNNKILINFTDKAKNQIIESLKTSTGTINQYFNKYFTKKHTKEVLSYMRFDKQNIKDLNKDEMLQIAIYLTEYEVIINKVESKERSYVNKGGILTKELSPYSFESKKYKGLYFIGETTDIHGPIGGYNITIALSSGMLSALDIIEKTGGKQW